MAWCGRRKSANVHAPEVVVRAPPPTDRASSATGAPGPGPDKLAADAARPPAVGDSGYPGRPGPQAPARRPHGDSGASESEPLSEAVPETSIGSAEAVETDDLDWAPDDGTAVQHRVSQTIDAGRILTRTVTEASRRLTTAALAAAEDSDPDDDGEDELECHKVQVYFDDGWHDFSPEETKIILAKLEEDVTEFRLNLRGRDYAFSFSADGEASQTNVKTGRKRKVRLVDGPATEEATNNLREEASVISEQRRLGPQSKRGNASQSAIAKYLDGNKHAQSCFEAFERNEAKLCAEWAVFYHSYSFAALIYEVHAAVASVLFRFRSQYAALPRILVRDFLEVPDATCLVQKFNTIFAENKRDHNPGFRKVGISAMCSLASTGPEACVARVFVSGYSCKDVSFKKVLENVLEACYVPRESVAQLGTKILKLSEKHGLDVSQFGGKPCKSQKPGHLMQIFVRRSLVDHLVYAAEPYGPVDTDRMPMSKILNSDANQVRGQARLVAHPKYFMQANCVRMFVASADPTFHKNRVAFQEGLCDLIKELGEPALRERAAAAIHGGTLPAWWSSADQRNMA